MSVMDKKLTTASTLGYASPVAAKSATGFESLNENGGYRHCSNISGIFVSSAWLASGRSCGEPSGSLVCLFASLSTRTVALFAFESASGAFINPTKRRKTMQNTPHLRLIKGHQTQTNQPQSKRKVKIVANRGDLREVLDVLFRDFDYLADFSGFNRSQLIKNLAHIIGRVEVYEPKYNGGTK